MSFGDNAATNEPQRLAAVRRYDILDTPPDGAFERITAIAARHFEVPIAIISIVDEDRIWFKSRHGLAVEQIGRDPGLCASAILSDNVYVLTDASIDPRALSNPLVASDFGLRFYAAAPLCTGDGHNLGTLCIIAKEPRPFSDKQAADLTDLAAVVMDQLELRLAARLAVAQAQLMAREIDHRVMNSLQFVSGLLAMQSRQPGAADAAVQLQAAATRVAAVAQVHRNFYSETADHVSCLAFLQRLCRDLSSILGATVMVSGDDVAVSTTKIQPIGLIVNELVTNAAKHGGGRIEVSYRIRGDRHEIIVSDEGPGLPPGFDPAARSSSLGMKVVTSLVNQLGGVLIGGTNLMGRGACFAVSFPPIR